MTVCEGLRGIYLTVDLPESFTPALTRLAITACTPVPDNVDACGLPEALSTTETDAERAPAAKGVNVTVMVQDALLPRFDPTGQLFD